MMIVLLVYEELGFGVTFYNICANARAILMLECVKCAKCEDVPDKREQLTTKRSVHHMFQNMLLFSIVVRCLENINWQDYHVPRPIRAQLASISSTSARKSLLSRLLRMKLSRAALRLSVLCIA